MLTAIFQSFVQSVNNNMVDVSMAHLTVRLITQFTCVHVYIPYLEEMSLNCNIPNAVSIPLYFVRKRRLGSKRWVRRAVSYTHLTLPTILLV